MKIDIGQVLANEHFILPFSCCENFSSLVMPDGETPFCEVSVSGRVRNRFNGIEISGTVETVAESLCARCLNQVRFPVRTPVEWFIGGADEDEPVRIENGRLINLHEAVTETLFDEYPSKVLCSEQCKGLCPLCGRDLNHDDCDCVTDSET